MLLVTLASALVGCGGKSDVSELRDSTSTDTAVVVHRIRTNVVPGRLKTIFNDSNHVQLVAAEENGFEPISSLGSAFGLSKPILRIRTNDDYVVDSLTSSVPFLVSKAANLLSEIGRSFADTVRSRGGHEYRIRVTSLTRTNYTVKHLRKRNINATDRSCHLYGTTFDISWIKFHSLDPSFVVNEEDLKNILAEILYDYRQQGRCYVKYEVKQGCFHVTIH